jgi:site-specific recombinase XerD
VATQKLSRRKAEQLSGKNPRSHRKPQIPLARCLETWVGDGKAQGLSCRTIEEREGTFRRLLWWLTHEAETEPMLDCLTPELIRRFLAYCRDPNPGGRFGSDRSRSKAQASPATVFAYFRVLRSFCHFCLEEGLLEENPMARVKPPRVPREQVQPFTPEQLRELLEATRQTAAPDRNRCILLLLVDTGLRVSELCSLKVSDVSNDDGSIAVVGKGGKRRTVYLGQASRRALRLYLRKWRHSAAPEAPLFIAAGGTHAGEGISTSGVRQMMKDLEQLSGVTGVRVSPHTLRHSFAIAFLRGGGNLFELQQLMGHCAAT